MSKRQTGQPFRKIASTITLSTAVIGLIAASGCQPTTVSPSPPSSAVIFEPDPNHDFGEDSGSVVINALSGAGSVCYTIDGTAPQYNGGTCSGGSTEVLTGNSIALACGSEAGSNTLKVVKVAFSWLDEGVVSRNANFILDCTPPAVDTDNDGIPDASDNCPAEPNPDQADTNNNGVGDVCDTGEPIADRDGDTRVDDFDNCPDVWNKDQGNQDGDNLGDVCDSEPYGPAPAPWANDDLALAFVHWKDDIQCDIRCSDPTGGGDMGTVTCANGGTANWTVEVNIFGGKADSYFTYNNCEFTSDAGDHLIVDGQLIQYSDFDGNGNEQGTVTITGGDYVGVVESHTVFHSKTRDGGHFSVSCTEDPLDGEICAPNSALIDQFYPDWACAPGVCPETPAPLIDNDGDGVYNEFDNCPDTNNPDQANADFDEFGDDCDDSTNTTDGDSDGVPDDADNCPSAYNPTQDDEDGDGLGDECDNVFNPDSDGDGVVDGPDNCIDVANPGQEDQDADGDGDACDATPQGPDSDNDGVPDMQDNCPAVVNNSQADSDGDGIGNACDPDPGFVQIFFKVGDEPGRCLKDADKDLGWGGEVKSGTSCSPDNLKAQWQIIDVPGGPTAAKLFKNLLTNECLENFDVLGWMNLRTRACDTGNSNQQWTIERYNDDFDFRYPSRLHAVNRNSCIYTNATGDAFGTAGNCNLQGTENNRQVGIYFAGDFSGSEPYEP